LNQLKESSIMASKNTTPAGKASPAAKTSTAVAVKPDAAQAVSMVSDDVPEWLKQQEGPGRGSENVGADDLVIPRLELVQDLSPCRKRADPNYIEGCEEGMLYNNVTRQLYGTEVLAIPVYFRKEWLIWKDRNQGGGFRGAFSSPDEAQAALAELEDADACQILDTAQYFCLLLHPTTGKIEEIAVSMSKSKMKVSRKWNSLMRLNGGDTFSRVYRISAVGEKNSKNQDFFNLQVASAGFPSQALFKKAEEFYKSISAGKVSVDRRQEEAEEGSGGPAEY
jgi:hypothetical protein